MCLNDIYAINNNFFHNNKFGFTDVLCSRMNLYFNKINITNVFI